MKKEMSKVWEGEWLYMRVDGLILGRFGSAKLEFPCTSLDVAEALAGVTCAMRLPVGTLVIANLIELSAFIDELKSTYHK